MSNTGDSEPRFEGYYVSGAPAWGRETPGVRLSVEDGFAALASLGVVYGETSEVEADTEQDTTR